MSHSQGRRTRGNSDMTIRERIIRRLPEDIIYLGDLVEKHMYGEFGEVLDALTQGRINEEVLKERNGVSPDRILGRCEMAARLSQDLEQYVVDRDEIMKPLEMKEKETESPIADEVLFPKYGGTV